MPQDNKCTETLVTDAMIEAGANYIHSHPAWDDNFSNTAETVHELYNTMEAARASTPATSEPVGDELVGRLRLKDGRVPGYSELVKYCSEAAAALQAKDRQIAELRARYDELIYAVANKYEGETRHETALRYIFERQNRPVEGPCKALGGQHVQAK